MASPSFGNNLDARLPSSFPVLATHTQNPPIVPPAPRLADFQFKTIGQQPGLLKRISAPIPDKHYDHDFDPLLSPSSLLSDQSTQAPPLPESDSAKRPSLQDRLSLLESPNTAAADITMADPLEIRPPVDTRSTQSIDVLPMTPAHRSLAASSSEGLPAISRTGFLQARSLGKKSDLSHDMIIQEQAIRITTELGVTSSSETQARVSPPLAQILTQASGSGVSTPFSDVHSLMGLRILQSRLSSSLANLNPISTVNALAAAQSAKDQCTEILATAHRAHTLAKQASSLAQDSMVATQECLNVAATIQSRADLALSAVEKIRSGQGIDSAGELEYNAAVDALKDDLHELAEWVRQRDAYESKYLHQPEDHKIEKLKKNPTPQLNGFSADKQSHNFSTIQTEVGIMTVEDEADAATRAWNQHCEQSAERKRLAEEELRKRRGAEIELERQRRQAQSEVDAREAELEKLRAERLKAEEEERSRQEKEALELQRQQQELEIARFLRSQKQAQDNLVKIAAEEKKKAQAAEAEKEARLIAEHEQKRREVHEKEILKRQEVEKTQALLAESEAKRREKVISEQMKRVAQQPPVSTDIVNVLDKAREKQSMTTLTTDSRTPLSQHGPLPSSPPYQASVPSNANHAEFGNVVSKKTMHTNSPRASMQQNKTLSGSIRLDEPLGPVNLTSFSSIPKSSTSIQEGAKFHELTPSIPLSIDKPLTDNSTSSYIHEADHRSGDGNIGLKSPSSLSPLTPMSEGNSSHPVSMPPEHVPSSRSSSNDFEDIHSEKNIPLDGPGAGNISVFPPRVFPLSAEVQRANLQPFMDANGISYGLGADLDERKLFSGSAHRPSVTTERSHRKPLSSSQMNGDQICRTSSASKPGLVKKPKLEPQNDIPVLSMPTPPPICAVPPTKPKLPEFKKDERVSSMTTLEIPSSSRELPVSPQTMPPPGSFAQAPEPAVTTLDSPNSPVVSKEKVRPAAVRRNVPPLESNEQRVTRTDAINQPFQAGGVTHSVSPRMGPDAAVRDGRAQPVDDLMAKRIGKDLDRSSPRHAPSVNSQDYLAAIRPRGPPPRTNDHYSPPRRISDRLPSYNDYSRDRRRSGSVEQTRGSPQPKYNDNPRSSLTDIVPVAGRKRHRDDDLSDIAPPTRRHRFDSPPFRQDVQPLTLQHDGDWSRMTAHGRSPSPESRLTPLVLRLESEKPPWKSQGGSSYRPIYNNTNSYAYEPQSRNNKNHRHPASHSQPITQTSRYYGDVFVQSNQQRPPVHNDIMTDTRLPLINRFTDSAEQTQTHPSFNSHNGPTRLRPFRGGRGGGNHALEHRISKPKPVSLINRLENAN